MMKFQSLNTLTGSNTGNGKSTMWMEYLPGRMGIFHCYVSLPEGNFLCFVELKGPWHSCWDALAIRHGFGCRVLQDITQIKFKVKHSVVANESIQIGYDVDSVHVLRLLCYSPKNYHATWKLSLWNRKLIFQTSTKQLQIMGIKGYHVSARKELAFLGDYLEGTYLDSHEQMSLALHYRMVTSCNAANISSAAIACAVAWTWIAKSSRFRDFFSATIFRGHVVFWREYLPGKFTNRLSVGFAEHPSWMLDMNVYNE